VQRPIDLPTTDEPIASGTSLADLLSLPRRHPNFQQNFRRTSLPVENCLRQIAGLYLGYVISANGIAPDPMKVEAVLKFPEPNDATGVKSFLGLTSYYRKFVANFAKLATPLNDLLKKNAKFYWSDQCKQSYSTSQRALTSAPVLKFPDFSQPFLLQTDASGIGLGVVLAQHVNCEEHPIAYASRTLKPAERNYSVFEQEAF